MIWGNGSWTNGIFINGFKNWKFGGIEEADVDESIPVYLKKEGDI